MNNRQRVALALTCWALASVIVAMDRSKLAAEWSARGGLLLGVGTYLTVGGDVVLALAHLGAGITILIGWRTRD